MYKSIGTNELKGLIGRINIIDIRDNYIYKMGNIPSSKNIPANFLITSPSNYLDKNDTYYIYCSFGMQSNKVCYKLSNLGYNVINVIGGYNDYISKI